ncbi:MAG: sigma-70 family RNA polymerase sigma factor, partial [Oscillospiraceae bacterium]|nr:sigma-70 family RNA polymerase sigma factor [Oscillospiraceae bacterium]
LSPEQPSPAPGPEEQALRRALLEELPRALENLSQKDRILFHRKYYYLQSIAQIAAEMGMTERAVEGRLYRLKKRLRKELGGALL